ncbi:MAG: hypothetical protein RLZZ535_2731, partial [Cyanobacteriota bacterium]
TGQKRIQAVDIIVDGSYTPERIMAKLMTFRQLTVY